MTKHTTEHKTMNTIVHAAFRRDLARFDAALRAFPAGNWRRAVQLKTAWDWFAGELHHHHDYEETYFWPALGEAAAAMDHFHANPAADAAAAARSALAHLNAVLLGHLAHEERDLEPISAHYATAPPMKAATKKVIKAHKGRLGGVLAWLQDGADVDARRALRQEIPLPVVLVATGIGGRRYRRDIATVWSSPSQ